MTPITTLSLDGYSSLKKVAFEYIVLKMAKWYATENHLENIDEFNKNNNLGITQLLLYPFFTCIANGSFDKLYDLFSPFYALDDGPISYTALNQTVGNSMEYFEVDLDQYKLKIKDTTKNLGSLENDIKATQILTSEGPEVRFDSIIFDVQTAKKVVDSIDSSILAIKKQSNNKFILFDDYQIVTLARQHRAWSTIFNYYQRNSATNIGDLEIPKKEVEKDRKVYRSTEELPEDEKVFA